MSKGISGTQLVQNLKEGIKDGMILTKKDKTFIGEPDYIPGRKGDGQNYLKEEKGMYKFD